MRFQHSVSVPYAPWQMYDLVCDIESYPGFLPWCQRVAIAQKTDVLVEATLFIAMGKLQSHITTENELFAKSSIHIRSLSGPLKSMQALWEFRPLSIGDGCMIAFEIDFEFKNTLLKITLGRLFNHIISTIVDSFVKRANQLYGHC